MLPDRAHESRSLQLLATAGPALVVGMVALLTVQAVQGAAATRAQLEHSYGVVSAAERVLQGVVDAESAQRGFTATGEELFLEPIAGAEAALVRDLAELRRLASAPAQQERVRELAPAVEATLAAIRRNVEIRRGRTAPRPDAGLRLARNKVLMDEVRRRVGELQREEHRLLQLRAAREASRTRRAFGVVVAGGLLSMLATVMANLLFARHAAEWRRLAAELEMGNAQLQDQAAQLEMQSVDLETQATELEESADALRRSEHRFRSLIENSSDLITVLEHDGTIAYQSPNVRRVLGYAPGDLLGTSLFDLADPQEAAQLRRRLLERAPEQGAEISTLECRFRHADGSWRMLEITTSVLPWHPDGRDLVLNSRDVTERRRAEAHLHRTEEILGQASKMEALGRLAGGVAHDFNNLLTVIGGNAELLRSEVTPSGREILDEITEASGRAKALTRQMLVFSRRDAAEPHTVVAVNEVLQGVLGMLRRLISESIEIHLSLDPRAGSVRVDPRQLEQVVINLAVNASDAMPQGGHLTIETRAVTAEPETLEPGSGAEAPRRAVLLAVSDTGVGMDAQTRARVFEPFFTTKPPGKGTGLGLSTTYGIVQQSGGNVLVYSEEGLGTTFKIYLPEAEPAPAREAAKCNGAPLGGTETILLVEDEPGVRTLLSRVLRQSGYRVLPAASPAEAAGLAHAHSGPIHLLVTDVVMPGGSGIDLAQALRAERPGLRVLCMSGYTSDAISHHGIDDTGMAFIQKPCTPAELRRAVHRLLHEPECA